MRAGLFLVIGLVATACSPASQLPDMQPGETGRVVRIIDGDALALNTGQSVRLIGIEAPALRPRGRDPDPYAVEAARALEDLALGREVQLHYPGLTRDRYDRALAHVVTRDGAGPRLWLNIELVRRGAARVRLYPDTAAQGEVLLAAEATARLDRVGLWAKTAYRVPTADEVDASTRGFMLVQGRLDHLESPEGRYRETLACQWALSGAALALQVRRDAASVCDLPVGSDVRLRGWVSNQSLDVTHPLHVELLNRAVD